MRGDYLKIAILLLYLAEELLEAVAQGGSFRQPERQAGTYTLAEGEEFHLFAELAVVALLRFFEQGKIFVEHFLLREGYAVYSDELVALLVAAPVGSGERHDFHGLDCAGIGDVGATAEVGEGALGVGCYVAVFELADELAFIGLAAVAEHCQGVGF